MDQTCPSQAQPPPLPPPSPPLTFPCPCSPHVLQTKSGDNDTLQEGGQQDADRSLLCSPLQVHQVDSTDLMLSTAASHTPNAPTPRYRVLIQDQTGGAQFQYVPPAAKAQPQFHRKLYDAKMSYAQDVPLHYRSHAAENNQAAQGLAHLPSDAGLELWDAAYPHRAQHAEFEPQPQDAESENQPHNWHMERVTVPVCVYEGFALYYCSESALPDTHEACQNVWSAALHAPTGRCRWLC